MSSELLYNNNKLIANTSLDLCGITSKKKLRDTKIHHFIYYSDGEMKKNLIKKRMKLSLKGCGKNRLAFGCGCGELKFIRKYCYNKMCTNPECISFRASRLKKKYWDLLTKFKEPKLLTLTYKGHHENVMEEKRKMEKCFKEFLRRLPLSGMKFYEIKPKDDGYYIHIHCIIDSPFVLQDQISKTWYDITGSSYVCDIRRIKTEKAIEYVLKYLSKVSNRIGITEYVKFYYKQRMVSKFGKYYGWTGNEGVSNFLNCKFCGMSMEYLSWWNDIDLTRQIELLNRSLFGRETW